MTDLTKLKELAERATGLCPLTDSLRPEMMGFIDAANPQAILGLIADLEEAREGMKYSHILRLKNELDRLKAENEALRKQLEQVHPFKFAGQHEGPDLKCAACGGYHYGLPPNMPCPKSAAIAQDAALEGGGR